MPVAATPSSMRGPNRRGIRGRLLDLGARHFRVEFVQETPAQVERTIARYRQLLRGEISGADLWKELKLLHQLGVTRGPMERPNDKFCPIVAMPHPN